jgi:hypothetical protein
MNLRLWGSEAKLVICMNFFKTLSYEIMTPSQIMHGMFIMLRALGTHHSDSVGIFGPDRSQFKKALLDSKA